MPKPVLVSVALLALSLLSPAAFGDEPTKDAPKRPRATHHERRAHGRRARVEPPPARARAGTAAKAAPPEARPAPKRAPVEKAASIGHPNEGRLEGGVHVDVAKPYFRVVPQYESGDVRWGLPQLVGMIDRAARVVAKRYPGSVLDVGDLSKKGGGDVLRHHSHETGRDADLGFYALDARGRQIHGHGFIKFDASMESPTNPGARYDLARNWLFIQELLTDRTATVSHIFIAEPIRQRLLAYAKPRVSRALYERAAVVLMQPTQSLPHDDHIHVRISCPTSMRGTCVELAKNISYKKHRVARRGKQPGGHGHAKHPSARPMRPPAAAGVTSQDPFELDPYESEGDDDVHGGVDESGALRITD